MNLQMQRRLEQFARLAELPVVRVEPRMEFSVPPMRQYIEVVDERVLLTLAVKVRAAERLRVFKSVLAACHPAPLHGVPVRAYVARDYQLVSCAPAPDSDSGLWLACHKFMRRVLEQHTGSYA